MSELASIDELPATPAVQLPEAAGDRDFVENPQEAATAAMETDAQHTHRVRDAKIKQLVKRLPPTPVSNKLQNVMRRSFEAGQTLAVIGYNNLRHLIAEGFTLPEIAQSADINVLDLAYFLQSHDPGGNNMDIDNTLCADSQSQRIYTELDEMIDPSKEQVAVKQLKLQLIEKRNARLSDRWAGLDAKNSTLLDAQATRIVIMMGAPLPRSAYNNNPRVIDATSNSAAHQADDKLPLTEDGRLAF